MPNLFAVFITALFLAQQPSIQNGRVEPRNATSLDREVATLGGGPDPVWVAWRAPMVDGDPNVCSTWGDGRVFVRGETLESRPLGSQAPQFPAATGPARLEAGT